MPKEDVGSMSVVACCDNGTEIITYSETLPAKIQSDDAAKQYLLTLDFTQLKEIIAEETKLAFEEIESAELRYKQWLFLRRLFPDELMPPPKDIDMIWHYHLLDTQLYFKATSAGLGFYLHHYPYFGRRGKADKTKLLQAFENTKKRWQEAYGEDIGGALPSRQQ